MMVSSEVDERELLRRKKLGDSIRDWVNRQHPKMYITDLARRLGPEFPESTVRAVVLGTRPMSREMAAALAPLMQVMPEDLLHFGYDLEKELATVSYMQIPLLSWSALRGLRADEMTFEQCFALADGKTAFPRDPRIDENSSLTLLAEDDANAPRFPKGTRQVFGRSDVSPGNFVLAFVNGVGPVVRKFAPEGTDAEGRQIVRLIPENPDREIFPIREITDGVTGKIVGKLVAALNFY